MFFDQVKPKLEDALTMDVKKIFCGDPYVEATLPSIVKDWYEGLTVAAKNKVYANTAERIFKVFENATNDEHLLVEGLARVLTSLRIDDWTDSNISAFREKMEMYKDTLGRFRVRDDIFRFARLGDKRDKSFRRIKKLSNLTRNS